MRELFNSSATVTLTAFYSLQAMVTLPFRGGRSVTVLANRWAKTVNWVCGIRVRIDGLDRPLDAPAYVVVANHTSHSDLLALYAAVPVDMRPVAKRELGRIPIFGWVLRAGVAIMIDRGDRQQAQASIERAARTIRAGRSVLMFPEGTRTPPGELGPLKKGPFHLALEAGVPMLPVGIVGSGDILMPGQLRVRSGVISVHVGKPISTRDFENTTAGREALMAAMANALKGLMAQGHIGLDSPRREPYLLRSHGRENPKR